MIAQASANFVRVSPRKVRYVLDHIRGKSVREAQAILHGSPRRPAGIVAKLLGQAVDAAEKNSQVKALDLKISKVLADGGPTMKRFRAMSMGRAGRIRKRTSHILLELDRISGAPVAAPSRPVSAKTPVKKSNDKTASAKAAPAKSRGSAAHSGGRKTAGAK